MGVYYFLYAPETKQGINLAKKVHSRNPPYEGVSVFVDGHLYRLPEKYLRFLIDRFTAEHHGRVIFVEDHILFDSGKYLSEEDDYILEIGGDCDYDLPLTRYLPELNDLQVQAEIKAHPELMI